MIPCCSIRYCFHSYLNVSFVSALCVDISLIEVREYLDDLKTSSATSEDGFDVTMISDDDELLPNNEEDGAIIKPKVGDGRDFERWLF